MLALADAALAAKDAEIVELHQGAQELRQALDSTTVALADVRASQRQLEAKARVLVVASKPSLLARIAPHPGFGIAAGVNALGQPQIIVGVTLGWSR